MKLLGVTGSSTDGVLAGDGQLKLNARQRLVTRNVLDHWMGNGFDRPYPLVAMPTGFGKSRVIHSLTTRLDHDKILLIVGTKNILLDQSYSVLKALVGAEAGDLNFSILPDTSGQVVLTTWQGLNAAVRRGIEFPEFGLAVIDEVHNIGTARRLALIKHIKPESVVGLTATAYRSTGDFRHPSEYGFTIVDSMSLPSCIHERWLSPLVGIAIDTELILPADVREGETLNLGKISREFRKHPDLFPRIADEMAERFLPTGMKTLVVVNRVEEEACVIARRLIDHGYRVGLAINQDHAHRLRREFVTLDAIERYNLPESDPWSLQVLVSPQVISEGFDAPATECVAWAAPTLSGLRYTQVNGRAARRCKGKKYALIVDFVYLIENYGYSYNFAQFIPKDELKDLGDGMMYVGPDDIGKTIEIPPYFTARGRVVSVLELRGEVVPEAGGWLSMRQLRIKLGVSQNWVGTRIVRFKHLGQLRRNQPDKKGRTGKATFHYPPEVLDELRAEREGHQNPGNDLLNLAGLERYVGKEGNPGGWLQRQLERYKDTAVERRSDRGRVLTYYPLWVAEALKRMLSAYPLAGDWLTAGEITKVIGSNYYLVTRLLKRFRHLMEKRRNRFDRIYEYYPPSVVDQLRALL